MSFPPKLVTIFCLIQTLCVVVGFLLTRGALKLYDQVIKAHFGNWAPEIPRLPGMVRAYGPWFLLVPIC